MLLEKLVFRGKSSAKKNFCFSENFSIFLSLFLFWEGLVAQFILLWINMYPKSHLGAQLGKQHKTEKMAHYFKSKCCWKSWFLGVNRRQKKIFFSENFSIFLSLFLFWEGLVAQFILLWINMYPKSHLGAQLGKQHKTEKMAHYFKSKYCWKMWFLGVNRRQKKFFFSENFSIFLSLFLFWVGLVAQFILLWINMYPKSHLGAQLGKQHKTEKMAHYFKSKYCWKSVVFRGKSSAKKIFFSENFSIFLSLFLFWVGLVAQFILLWINMYPKSHLGAQLGKQHKTEKMAHYFKSKYCWKSVVFRGKSSAKKIFFSENFSIFLSLFLFWVGLVAQFILLWINMYPKSHLGAQLGKQHKTEKMAHYFKSKCCWKSWFLGVNRRQKKIFFRKIFRFFWVCSCFGED